MSDMDDALRMVMIGAGSAALAAADSEPEEDERDSSGWKLTSVRWLKQYRSEYIGGTRGRGAHGQLSVARAG